MDKEEKREREVGGGAVETVVVVKKKIKKRESHTQGLGTVTRDQASMAFPSCDRCLDPILQDRAKRALAAPMMNWGEVAAHELIIGWRHEKDWPGRELPERWACSCSPADGTSQPWRIAVAGQLTSPGSSWKAERPPERLCRTVCFFFLIKQTLFGLKTCCVSIKRIRTEDESSQFYLEPSNVSHNLSLISWCLYLRRPGCTCNLQLVVLVSSTQEDLNACWVEKKEALSHLWVGS